jgi:TIR domain
VRKRPATAICGAFETALIFDRREGIDVAGGVFISYRREESAFAARAIHDRVAQRLERENVFLDVDNIDLGVDWFNVLTDRVGACDALVAVIGRNWISNPDAEGRRRIDDADDYVRIEIEAALERNVRVIPVLVDGAAMPKASDLPESLKGLARRQGTEISHARFEADVEKLTLALGSILDERRRRDAAEAERAKREREEAEAAQRAKEQERLAREAVDARRKREEEQRFWPIKKTDFEQLVEQNKAENRPTNAEMESARKLVTEGQEATGAARQKEEERRAKKAAEAERTALEERKRQVAAEAARADEARQKAEAGVPRRVEEERQIAAEKQDVAKAAFSHEEIKRIIRARMDNDKDFREKITKGIEQRPIEAFWNWFTGKK